MVDGSIRVSDIGSFSIQAVDCVRCRLIDRVKLGVTFFVLKVQMKWFFFIPEFERAIKIRKIAVYRFTPG